MKKRFFILTQPEVFKSEVQNEIVDSQEEKSLLIPMEELGGMEVERFHEKTPQK